MNFNFPLLQSGNIPLQLSSAVISCDSSILGLQGNCTDALFEALTLVEQNMLNDEANPLIVAIEYMHYGGANKYTCVVTYIDLHQTRKVSANPTFYAQGEI
jgi:hypothetical protein